MVKKDNCVYLFIGQDIIGQDGSSKKDTILKRIKQKFLISHNIEEFNRDILYARELSLKDLQKRFLSLPLKAKKRIIIIRDAQYLKQDLRKFILDYLNHPKSSILLVLDINRLDPKDEFVRRICRYAQIYHFKETARLDTFYLSRQIDLKRGDFALRILNQLLKEGEKPERILGGLRYIWQREITEPLQIRKRVKLLLNCDLEIKTGRLRPDFALEKLVVRLCSS